jgi:hypothetical protein
MTDLKLSATKVADVERVADALGAELVAKVQTELEALAWTDDLDAEDWVEVQSQVLQRLALKSIVLAS